VDLATEGNRNGGTSYVQLARATTMQENVIRYTEKYNPLRRERLVKSNTAVLIIRIA
jgi:hypothetical protein